MNSKNEPLLLVPTFENGLLIYVKQKKSTNKWTFVWALTDSNRRPSACKADALNQLS